MPFDDENNEEKIFKPKVKLKNNNQSSIFDNKEKQYSKEAAFKAASEANSNANEYKKKAVELALKYKKILENKILSQNKTEIELQIEKETIKDLVNLAIEINTDETEQEGMGSMGVIAMLLQLFLVQRDKINELQYTCSEFNRQLKEINLKLKKEQNENGK